MPKKAMRKGWVQMFSDLEGKKQSTKSILGLSKILFIEGKTLLDLINNKNFINW